MASKPNPDKVHPGMARQAVKNSKARNEVYSQYILLHYRATGKLAPGCDARDLYAWMDGDEEVPPAFKR